MKNFEFFFVFSLFVSGSSQFAIRISCMVCFGRSPWCFICCCMAVNTKYLILCYLKFKMNLSIQFKCSQTEHQASNLHTYLNMNFSFFSCKNTSNVHIYSVKRQQQHSFSTKQNKSDFYQVSVIVTFVYSQCSSTHILVFGECKICICNAGNSRHI